MVVSIKHKLFVSVIGLSVVLVGCQASNNLSGGYGDAPPIAADFEKSSIQVQVDFVAADGTSSVVVLVYVRNNKGQPVVNYQPKYNVTGSGNIAIPCTLSNEDGLSVCLVKSTVVGQKNFAVLNLYKDLKTKINFKDPSQPRAGFSIATAATLKQAGRTSGGTTVAVGVTSIAESIGPFVLEKAGAPGITRAKTNYPGVLDR